MTAMTFTIGEKSAGTLIPISDNVLCKCTAVQPNKYNPDTVIDFGFTIIDFDFEDDDERTEAEIRALADREFVYWERCNIVLDEDGNLSKNGKLYAFLKGMRGGRDIEKGEQVDLSEFESKNFRIDFEHTDKKSGPPDYAVVRDDKGNAVQKNKIAKIRPEKRSRRQEAVAEVREVDQRPQRQAALPANDNDLFPEDDVDES